MSSKNYLRYLVVPLALAGLLFLTTTFGAAWHHHDTNSERACPICHFNHQPIEKPLASYRLPVLAPVRTSAVVLQPTSQIEPALRRVPARAPPAV
jgi:hypothetical protein